MAELLKIPLAWSLGGDFIEPRRRLAARCFALALAGFAAVGAAYCLCYVISVLPSVEEAGFGDSYVLFDTLRAARTGTIYPDLSEPPYLPAQYGPWLYLILAWPARLSQSGNPFLGPRLVALAAYLTCLLLVYLIAGTVWRSRRAAVWSVALAASYAVIPEWVLQLRSDFPAIACSLLSIWLVLRPGRRMIALAGIAAACAVIFKFTMVAAAVGSLLWLVLQGRRRQAAAFLIGLAAFLLGATLWMMRSEPRMIEQMLAMSPPILEFKGYWQIIKRVIKEPQVWLAASSLAFVRLRGARLLLFLFAMASLAVALVTEMQAGGNINYFYEFLFAMAPFAGYGAVRMIRGCHEQPVLACFTAALLALACILPVGMQTAGRARLAAFVPTLNGRVRAVERVLSDKRVFSTVPRLALASAQPPLIEPWTLSIWALQGKTDASIWTGPIRRGEYDVVVTFDVRADWRGIALIDRRLLTAITAVYSPYCRYETYWFHLPREGDSAGLRGSLDAIGCKALPR